jgi:6-phosphogluconolactonase/glucosamine-6-phosphate isomerase/deaminase
LHQMRAAGIRLCWIGSGTRGHLMFVLPEITGSRHYFPETAPLAWCNQSSVKKSLPDRISMGKHAIVQQQLPLSANLSS